MYPCVAHPEHACACSGWMAVLSVFPYCFPPPIFPSPNCKLADLASLASKDPPDSVSSALRLQARTVVLGVLCGC